MIEITVGQYNLIYNAFSFTFATMGAATLFFWFGRSQVAPMYRTALTITGLVTAIAAYHYLRIFQSWEGSYEVVDGVITSTGATFNDAYRYVDWFLTVPLLLIELILVMGLSRAETINKATRLGLLAALMIILGYPGEIAEDNGTRILFGVLSMIPFLWIVYELFVGIGSAIERQPADARGLVSAARWVTVLSWSFYPIVYFAGASYEGGTSLTIVQVGYTIADLVSKAVYGVLIYNIAMRKSEAYFASATPATGVASK